MESPVVLITGCSSGIGRDLARRLGDAGYRVVATARRPESLKDLKATFTLPLDVQDAAAVTRTVEQVITAFGRLDVLVNNAGYSQAGALEEVSDEALQQVFDVNLYGPMRLVRAVVPHMRRQRSARIIQVSSIAGRVAMPLSGAYCGTKFALEAMTDSLRLELRQFGIKVVLVEPGAIRTEFERTLRDRAEALFISPDSPYRQLYTASNNLSDSLLKSAPGPEVVSAVIQRAIESRHPKARYSMPAGQALQIQIARLLPDTLRDHLLASSFGVVV
ncbi:MAG: SDR family oxidoreductase [Symbiobacteriia bacterium]